MKSFKIFAPFILMVLFAFQLSYAATGTGQESGEYVSDAVITTKVKAAILAEPILKSSEIKVETYKGVVQLSGFVSSEVNMIKAVDIASHVKGVISVKNDMRLK
jgi:osmotically-inducible protein OsmY